MIVIDYSEETQQLIDGDDEETIDPSEDHKFRVDFYSIFLFLIVIILLKYDFQLYSQYMFGVAAPSSGD